VLGQGRPVVLVATLCSNVSMSMGKQAAVVIVCKREAWKTQNEMIRYCQATTPPYSVEAAHMNCLSVAA